MIHFFSAKRHRSGMALLEVMMAMTIFVMVGFALVAAFDEALDIAIERNQLERAYLGLKTQLVLLKGTRLTPQEKTLDDNSGIHYQLSINPEQVQNLQKQFLPGFYRIKIQAKWLIGKREEVRELNEIAYQP